MLAPDAADNVTVGPGKYIPVPGVIVGGEVALALCTQNKSSAAKQNWNTRNARHIRIASMKLGGRDKGISHTKFVKPSVQAILLKILMASKRRSHANFKDLVCQAAFLTMDRRSCISDRLCHHIGYQV